MVCPLWCCAAAGRTVISAAAACDNRDRAESRREIRLGDRLHAWRARGVFRVEEIFMVAGNSLLVGLFAFAAWGQTSEKVFYFTHLDTPQAMQEVTNLMRVVGDIRDLSPDVAKRSLTVKGTADQIAAAGWLTAEMDKAGSATGTRDYPFNDPNAPLAQVVYLTHVDNPRDLQEIVNGVRSVTDIQRCSPMNQQKAIVMRGSPEQVKAADWLLGVLDQPAGAPPGDAAAREYRL